jgi:hypothetical protein
MPANPIIGFNGPDQIDLVDLAYDDRTSIKSDGNETYTLTTPDDHSYTLHFVGLGGAALYLGPDAGGGTAITSIPCFRAGSRIATERGLVVVEDLRVGDVVQTISGRAQPIRWIGHRRVDCRRHPTPASVWPIRIAAGAFAPRRPVRNLWLSPDHAVFAEGVLIPVRLLINGNSIAQRPVETVTYFHLELPRHDVILAEGLTVESYLDTGDRHAFANGGSAMQLHPTFGPMPGYSTLHWEAAGYAPLVVTGPELARVRAQVDKRARPAIRQRVG